MAIGNFFLISVDPHEMKYFTASFTRKLNRVKSRKIVKLCDDVGGCIVVVMGSHNSDNEKVAESFKY